MKYVGPENAVNVAVGTMFAMHEEWGRVLGGRSPNAEDVPRLVYTGMVLREVRRLFPSVWMFLRFVREDTAFGDYAVPAGSVVRACAELMHRDPRSRGRLLPVQSGSAGVCAGEGFVNLQDTIILTMLGQHWRARLRGALYTMAADPGEAESHAQVVLTIRI